MGRKNETVPGIRWRNQTIAKKQRVERSYGYRDSVCWQITYTVLQDDVSWSVNTTVGPQVCAVSVQFMAHIFMDVCQRSLIRPTPEYAEEMIENLLWPVCWHHADQCPSTQSPSWSKYLVNLWTWLCLLCRALSGEAIHLSMGAVFPDLGTENAT